MKPNPTPMMKQYLEIKAQYPDAILFYRMGDFYEMFLEDATRAAKILEITLTSRNKNDQDPIPMCGVPYRAAQGYIARLIENGLKVAVCDQVEDPAQAKGLVKREVVRVITPGMIVENEFLDARSHNYVMAVAVSGEAFAIAYLDISTATFRLTQTTDLERLVDEVRRVAPSEVLIPRRLADTPPVERLSRAVETASRTILDDGLFDLDDARARLTALFRTHTLEGFGCAELKAGIAAAGALIYYVAETQKQQVEHLFSLETYYLTDYLVVDDQSCRNLELLTNLRTGRREGTLISVLDRTMTAMGARLFRHWIRYPLMDEAAINARLDAVEEALDHRGEVEQVRLHLKSVYDIERLTSRIVLGYAGARDLVSLKQSLNELPGVMAGLAAFSSPLFHWTDAPEQLQRLAELIERSIREDAPPTIHEGGIIKKGFHPDLDELIQITEDGKGWIARLETAEKEKTGIPSLKVRYNKVFGYYLEVPKTHTAKVPQRYERKQTLVNAERYITQELKAFEDKVLNAESERCTLEYRLFREVRESVKQESRLLQSAAAFIARTDALLNLAVAAESNDYTRPVVASSHDLIIEDGRHPVVEQMIAGERFVPNTVRMGDAADQILIITGPNMAGKSTVLRQVALTAIMAQAGSFVPARRAQLPVIDRIFTRVGALDNLSQGQSTFMVEMQETANILHNATPRSLVILDEIGRGTSTFDGLSLAWAIAEYLHDMKRKGVKTLFATHYHELTELVNTKPRAANYHIAVKENGHDIVFLRHLVQGSTNRSYGIHVARLAGIPQDVVNRAGDVLAGIEGRGQASESLQQLSEPRRKYLKRKRPTGQMGLFNDAADDLIRDLRARNIDQMTPKEAINFLYDLKEKTKFN